MTLLGNSDLDVYPLSLGGNTFGWTTGEAASLAALTAAVTLKLTGDEVAALDKASAPA
jgi:aryl-alcohol dehydrogenase-like predicted oxidoreductase